MKKKKFGSNSSDSSTQTSTMPTVFGKFTRSQKRKNPAEEAKNSYFSGERS